MENVLYSKCIELAHTFHLHGEADEDKELESPASGCWLYLTAENNGWAAWMVEYGDDSHWHLLAFFAPRMREEAVEYIVACAAKSPGELLDTPEEVLRF